MLFAGEAPPDPLGEPSFRLRFEISTLSTAADMIIEDLTRKAASSKNLLNIG